MTTRDINTEDGFAKFKQERKDFWDKSWLKFGNRKRLGGYYHRRLLKVYSHIVPAGSRILEIGCGNGRLIGNLDGREKIGVDFSQEAIKLATNSYPDCQFIHADMLDFQLEGQYDYIILSDLAGDLWDIQLSLEKLKPHCHRRTKIVINFYSKLWEGPLKFIQRLGLKKPTLQQNWLTRGDMRGLFYLAGFESVSAWQEILLPLWIPLFNWPLNNFMAKMPLFRHFALANFMVARLAEVEDGSKPATVSIIVAARNEEGHIEDIIARTPLLGSSTELIFVEGNSTDNTYQKIEDEIPKHPDRDIKLYKQPGKGKGDAVRKGFEQASGEILMILDADLTVPPEKLYLFYEALVTNKCSFANGVRLVYPMDKYAMRFFNLLGNKFFSNAFSYLLGQRIRDTLCGTKCLWKEDYERIAKARKYFGDFDPFGDFDLIFGAAKQNLKILDIPIRYKERVYGETNIQRWKHGWLLLKMVILAARKLKFV